MCSKLHTATCVILFMNKEELKRCFPDQPLDMFLRLLGVKPDELSELDSTVVTTLEVVFALYKYKLIPKVYEMSGSVIDAVYDWSKKDNRSSTVVVVNQRFILLRYGTVVTALDASNGKLVDVPDAANPVLTSALHLEELHSQTLSNLNGASKVEADPIT